ncbi:MAG: hypothetical protein CVV03_01335 [Firmicutes bacterium HGW-Firmicutes-8]|nr:MAG: hypothetical protein CVV03_01335 [Firmicutes bacterium HGW-Firmicutes-8]
MSAEGKIAKISAVWYLGISFGLSLMFFVITTLGNYPVVARYGGAIWVFILTIIISMPLVIPRIKKKYQ